MKLIKKIVLCAVFCLLIFIIAKCDSTEPPIEAHGLVLELEDVSSTEVWITLTTTNLQLPTTIILKQNDQTRSTINLVKADTLLYIDSLLPNQTYKFQSVIQSISQSSNELSVTTMDTTSHNFTFETFTFGDIGNSVLFDVAIVSPDDIWCVGEINIADTSINGYTTYNAVHWNGTSWNLRQVMFYTICGQQSRIAYPASSVFAFSESEIWIAMRGDQIAKIENGVQTQTVCSPWSFTINKIWGSNSNNLYVVGNNGNIVHYQNWQWSKITSGVSTDLLDIYGEGNNIFIGGWRDLQPSVLLKLKNGNVQKIIEDEDNLFNYRTDFISGAIYSVWLTEKKLYVITWYDLYRANLNTDGSADAVWKGAIQDWGMISVRGNDVNDIIASGVPGKIWHFNGLSWHTYNELIDTRDELRRIEIKGNVCVAVGERYENGIEDKALIHIGKR